MVILPSFPVPLTDSNSVELIPSSCAIERTRGEKNLFESDDLGSVVFSIAFSTISSATATSFGASLDFAATGASAAEASVSIIATA